MHEKIIILLTARISSFLKKNYTWTKKYINKYKDDELVIRQLKELIYHTGVQLSSDTSL